MTSGGPCGDATLGLLSEGPVPSRHWETDSAGSCPAGRLAGGFHTRTTTKSSFEGRDICQLEIMPAARHQLQRELLRRAPAPTLAWPLSRCLCPIGSKTRRLHPAHLLRGEGSVLQIWATLKEGLSPVPSFVSLKPCRNTPPPKTPAFVSPHSFSRVCVCVRHPNNALILSW